MVTDCPALSFWITFCRSSDELIAVPSMLTMTSPWTRPALSAGDPETTLRITAPEVGVKPYCWRRAGVSVVMSTPR